jgi:hypothetical protein
MTDWTHYEKPRHRAFGWVRHPETKRRIAELREKAERQYGDAVSEMTITPNIDNSPWNDLMDRVHPDSMSAPLPRIIRIGLLPQGTTTGRATVSVAIELADGKIVFAETTLKLFRTASRALMASPVAEAEPVDP